MTVVCPRPIGSGAQDQGNVNYEYIDVKFKQLSLRSRFETYISMRRRLASLLRTNQFDIVRTMGVFPTDAVLSSGTKPRVCAELTDFISDQYEVFDMPLKTLVVPLLRRFERRVAEKVDYAIVETPYERTFWSQNGLAQSKAVVIPNGVDVSHFQVRHDLGLLRERLGLGGNSVIACHGDIGKQDGLDYLFRALSKIDNVDLLVIGEGKRQYERKLQNLAHNLSIAERVHFTGWVKYELLPDYLALADAYALTILPITRQNMSSMPTRAREYLCMQKPFVCTDTKGLRWGLDDAPFYVRDPRDIDELSNALRKALDGHAKRQGSYMLEIAETLDWQQVVKMEERFMTAIVEGHAQDVMAFDWRPA